MDDYISRQAAIDSALNDDIVVMVANDDEDKDFVILEKTRKGIARNLEELPAADVVEVVRCKDCANRIKKDDFEMMCKGRGWPMLMVPADGFCNYGRKDEETDQ